ncbi:aldehyde dehydrogenase family protein [Parendozoicomonas haliclonae]|uniref:Succinate-semialdehyde dehydrogenase (Acetylating) n=1 Tax=Parendozoicomonas haliclonae TaxID=1960125 RepID=A0A1X7APW4_9GAMM|nr:aldehyde dehydrogenase family protein [Parendozoicomonas haliclonae]SMA50138.1 Succinate-semialdehyde dehydrogenase (acetylating) [Parendozoicomonas haliclonae]
MEQRGQQVEQQTLEDIVRQVCRELQTIEALPATSDEPLAQEHRADPDNGIFATMDEAITAAAAAQQTLFNSRLEVRSRIIDAICAEVRPQIEKLAHMGVQETGMGRVTDKILKHQLVLDKTPGVEDLQAYAFTGDDGLTVLELSPYGVIGAITPSTNPTETVICNAIGMIAAGNAVVFAPHPGARKVSLFAVELINQAIRKVGGPAHLVVTVAEPSHDNTRIMMEHPQINMLVATGGPGLVKAVMSSGKKAIGAGAGNPPVLVDKTADIEKAAADIVAGCSFDNNIPCIAEKEVIAVNCIADYLIFEMQKQGAWLLTEPHHIEALERLVLKDGKPVRDCIGRDAAWLLEAIGIQAPTSTRIILLETSSEHPFVQEEMLMPVLPLIRVEDADEGIQLAKKVEHGFRHTAIVHSSDINVLSRYAKELETTILVKNGPSFAGLGVGGEGHTTFTIAGPTGEGLTSARSFARNRRCVLVGSFAIK